MQCAAQLRALAVENALTLDEGMRLVETSGHTIHLDTNARQSPGVNDIGSGAQETDMSTRWQCETLVHFDHTNHTGLQVIIRDQIRLELVVGWDFGTIEVFFGRDVVFGGDVLELGLLASLGIQIFQLLAEVGFCFGRWALGLAGHLSEHCQHFERLCPIT